SCQQRRRAKRESTRRATRVEGWRVCFGEPIGNNFKTSATAGCSATASAARHGEIHRDKWIGDGDTALAEAAIRIACLLSHRSCDVAFLSARRKSNGARSAVGDAI